LKAYDSQKTYIGATVDVNRRLRQHNREIKGGAYATRGKKWKRILYVSGFPDWKSTLQFEWRWKKLSRGRKGKPLTKRFDALRDLLNLNRCTKTAIPFSEWPEIIIHVER